MGYDTRISIFCSVDREHKVIDHTSYFFLQGVSFVIVYGGKFIIRNKFICLELIFVVITNYNSVSFSTFQYYNFVTGHLFLNTINSSFFYV